MLLTVAASCGFGDKGEWENVKIHYDVPVFQKLFRKNQVLFFTSPDKIPDAQSRDILTQINAHQFLFGILGAPIPGENQLSPEEHLDELLENLIRITSRRAVCFLTDSSSSACLGRWCCSTRLTSTLPIRPNVFPDMILKFWICFSVLPVCCTRTCV